MAIAFVGSVDTLKRFRPCLVRFAQDVSRSLGEADTGIQRAIGRLETEIPQRWAREVTRRQDKLAQAKDAWRAKAMYKDSSGKSPAAIEEKMEVDRWTRAVEDAYHKIELCKRWRQTLMQGYEQYRAKVRGAADLAPMMNDLAIHELDRAVDSIEAYLALQGAMTELPTIESRNP